MVVNFRRFTGRLRGAWLRPPVLFLCLSLIAETSLADSREALQKAADLVQQGQFEQADREARRALSDPQTRAVAYSVLGIIRFQQRRLDDSAKFLQEAIRLDPRLLGAHLSLAEVYTLQGKQQRALTLFRRVLVLDPANVDARLALARVETEKGNYRESLALVKPVLNRVKQSPDGLLVLAADHAKLPDKEAAAALADDWRRLASAPPELSTKFALLLLEGGAVPEAVDILERVQQAGPTSYEAAFNLAGAYAANSDLARALDAYDKALSFNSQSVLALRQAAIIAERQGELERSLSYWVRARKLEPEDSEILLGFGRVCLKMDLLEDAELALSKAASLRPQEAKYQYTLAAAKTGRRQFEAAQSILQSLLKTHPGDPQLEYALGSVEYLQGHLPEAAAHLRESVRLQPSQVGSYYYLALAVRDQQNEGEAIRILEGLLQEHPEHAAAREVLGTLLMSANKYDDARQNLEEAVRLNPKSVKANYQLGLLLARMGKKDEADKQLEIAKSLRKEDEENSRLQLRLLDPDQ